MALRFLDEGKFVLASKIDPDKIASFTCPVATRLASGEDQVFFIARFSGVLRIRIGAFRETRTLSPVAVVEDELCAPAPSRPAAEHAQFISRIAQCSGRAS